MCDSYNGNVYLVESLDEGDPHEGTVESGRGGRLPGCYCGAEEGGYTYHDEYGDCDICAQEILVANLTYKEWPSTMFAKLHREMELAEATTKFKRGDVVLHGGVGAMVLASSNTGDGVEYAISNWPYLLWEEELEAVYEEPTRKESNDENRP